MSVCDYIIVINVASLMHSTPKSTGTYFGTIQ